jgi:hypothetical protein
MVKDIFDIQQDSGYESDVDQNEVRLNRFKNTFRNRLFHSGSNRICHQNISQHYRRLDSLARLLERNSVCVAIYYYIPEQKILIAANNIHQNSRLNSKKISGITDVMDLISTESLSITQIITRLSSIIIDNIKQEVRWDINSLNLQQNYLQQTVTTWLTDLFHSGKSTKAWLDDLKYDYYDDDKTDKLHIKLAYITARLVRDFQKIRNSLLQTSSDPLANAILQAIRAKQFYLVRNGEKDVHAEMRLLPWAFATTISGSSYIGLSKLCCNHCGLAIDSLGIQTRGKHGQGFEWPILNVINPDTPNNSHTFNSYIFSAFFGPEAIQDFYSLPADKRATALTFVQSKESSPFSTSNRITHADSSDSDVEFGLSCSDDDDAKNELKSFTTKSIWHLRYIKIHHSTAYYNLCDLNIPFTQIVNLFLESQDKFKALANTKVCQFIENLTNSQETENITELFARLACIYDDDVSMFWNLITDKYQLINKYGFNEVYERFYDKFSNEQYYISAKDKIDFYETIAADLDNFSYENNTIGEFSNLFSQLRPF